MAPRLLILLACFAALPARAEPEPSPAAAALCAGSTELWAEALADRRRHDPAAVAPERLADVERASALYRAVLEALEAEDESLRDLADQAYAESLTVWTNRREEGRKRTSSGTLTAKARNARAAQAELVGFLEWCVSRQRAFGARFLGG